MAEGQIHSIQSMGTLDGPGVRFVVFLQGCNLRCGCCHNPDTHGREGGSAIDSSELVRRALRYREYFGEAGGVTLSGGEPLLQAAFAEAFFREAKEAGLNTCLDTSGSLWSPQIEALLEVTDRVLLDVKFHTEELYRKHAGCSLGPVLAFLDRLEERKIPTVLRQVILPTLNDNAESMAFLKGLREGHACVEKIELLPFRKLCQVKYDQMGKEFPLGHLPEPTVERMQTLEALLH